MIPPPLGPVAIGAGSTMDQDVTRSDTHAGTARQWRGCQVSLQTMTWHLQAAQAACKAQEVGG